MTKFDIIYKKKEVYMSVNSYLAELQTELYVNGTEREKIRKSIDAISTRLDLYFGKGKRCEHKIIKEEIFGSYSRDTMLSRKYDEKSDIDYMIVFEDSQSYNTQTCLNWLKGFAEFWYSTSIVKQSLPTIVIELENIKFELVPAYENSLGNKYIPKDSSDWQYTNPKDLNNKITTLNINTSYEFKRLIRVIKYWNVNRNCRKFESYELETFLTNKFQNSYSNCKNAFDFLDWGFFYLEQHKYVDDYVANRIKRAIQIISEAKTLEYSGEYQKAVDKIKLILE